MKPSHSKVLYDLAKNGVEHQDPLVREKYDQFKLDVTKQALKIMKERIPVKILEFNEQVNIKAIPGEFLHSSDLEQFIAPANPIEENVEPKAKRERRASVESLELPASLPSKHHTTIYRNKASLHSQILAMEGRVRKEALELIEMISTVKLWIQLNIPRIEDGNNFGVAIQEEAIQELCRVEDVAFSLCDGIKYHTTRAKLISKVIKYPNVEDYTQSVLEVDQKEWLHLKISLIDMRNSYSMLYDLLHKNWEKVVKPRSADGNFMVM